MKNQFKLHQREIAAKVNELEAIKVQLKTEFIGIDPVIDKVIDNVRSWYIMSFIQERPCVINLWGLTGVGKTSLVLRLMELINYTDFTFRFDLGEKEGGLSFRNSLSDLCEMKNDTPVVIVLDEFQHTRTLKGDGPFKEEIENDKNRMIWELIDSGKVTYIDWKRGVWAFEDVTMRLKKLIQLGVEVENGIVVKGHENYLREMNANNRDNEPLCFFPKEEYESVLSYAGEYLNLSLKQEVEEKVMKMDGPETIAFLIQVIAFAQRPSIKNFSKALIFILGNIDEAFTMSGNFSTEISADDFYEASLKITVPQMKRSLKKRFRDEQIARLGNTHVIYPSLSKQAFYQIIDMELHKIGCKVERELGLILKFDRSIRELVYSEGVYPTQGVRPLLTTIQNLIKSKLSIFFESLFTEELNADQLLISIKDSNQLIGTFYKSAKIVKVQLVEIELVLQPLREPKQDESQAIVAVHESGHAVLSIALMQVIPELVVSSTTNNDCTGFVFYKDDRKFMSKKDVILKAATLLGGLVAEELLFGKENITLGAGTDLSQATRLISTAIKEEGFGKEYLAYAKTDSEATLDFHDNATALEQIKELMLEARSLAMEVLKKEIKLLVHMAEKLALKAQLDKKEITLLAKAYFTEFEKQADRSAFYRDKLKEHVTQLKRIETNKFRKIA